jgi:hypothetical protein
LTTIPSPGSSSYADAKQKEEHERDYEDKAWNAQRS